jgi:hypothetical protein
MTTFADELRALGNADLDAFHRAIFEAQKFVIDPTLLDLVRMRHIREIQAGAQFVRMPFPSTWIEYSFRDSDERVKVGALCRQVPGSNGSAFRLNMLSRTGAGQVEFIPREALVDMADADVIHFEMGYSPFASPEAVAILRENEPGEGFARKHDTTVMSVTHVLIGALMFLAARGGARTESVKHDAALQRSRERSGKAPLYSYSRLRIDVSKHEQDAERQAHEQASGPRAAMRGHAVRGHFKIIKGRSWWWRPHIRGDLKQGFVVKTYDLQHKGSADANPVSS